MNDMIQRLIALLFDYCLTVVSFTDTGHRLCAEANLFLFFTARSA